MTRFSLNQMSMPEWNIKDTCEACYNNDISWIGLNRDKVKDTGLNESVKIIKEYGLNASSLCVRARFTSQSKVEREERVEDCLRAIDEASKLDVEAIVLTGGGLNGCDIISAREIVKEGIARIATYAEKANVKIGIEPLHPVFASDRSVIATLGEANDIVEYISSSHVGVIIDVYHVWWDAKLYDEIKRSKGKIFGYHVNDWITPIIEPLTSRGMMGEGSIDLKKISKAIEDSKYEGPIEVEIFNKEMWKRQYDDVLKEMIDSFKKYV